MSDEKENINNENVDEAIKQRLHSIFPDPDTAGKVVNMIVRPPRPEGWSHRSNAPYYKEIYAKIMKKDVDRMIENHCSLTFRYSTWCSGETGMSEATLYNRINQAARYLVERMDTPDGKYSDWYQRVRVNRIPKTGVVISWIPGISEEDFQAELSVEDEMKPKWKERFDKWIEDEDDYSPFIQEGLLLSPEDVKRVKLEVANLETVQAYISHDVVKAVKIK